MGRVDVDALHAQLDRWATAHYHEGVTATPPEVMPGHAGLSFGFRVEHNGVVLDDLVVRLLRALGAAGVPVPPVPWWDADEQWFGVPYLMTARLPGSTYAMRAPAPEVADIAPGDVLRQAIDALAAIH